MSQKPKYDYEKAVSRLEEITIELEKGDLSLQESLTLFEEGVNLVKKCTNILDVAEGKIKVLTENMDGEMEFRDFDGGLIND